jgi:nicotinamide-nucleotide amidase
VRSPHAETEHVTVHDFDQTGDRLMSDRDRDPHKYVYTPALEDRAAAVLKKAHDQKLSLAAAESCTGGALAALLTDVEGLSHVFERGYVVYTDEAKHECLGIDAGLIETKGAVSEAVAMEMARGALKHSNADVAIAITGNAGPAGPDDEEGLVYIAAASRDGLCKAQEHHFGAIGRANVRVRALEAAFNLFNSSIGRT